MSPWKGDSYKLRPAGEGRVKTLPYNSFHSLCGMWKEFLWKSGWKIFIHRGCGRLWNFSTWVVEKKSLRQ